MRPFKNKIADKEYKDSIEKRKNPNRYFTVKRQYDIDNILSLSQDDFNRLDGDIKYFACKADNRIEKKFFKAVTDKTGYTYYIEKK